MLGNVIKIFAVVSLSSLICSCYEDHTEVWLNADGSGTVDSKIVFEAAPAALAKGQGMNLNSISAQQFIDDQEGIRLVSASTTDSPVEIAAEPPAETADIPEVSEFAHTSTLADFGLGELGQFVHELNYEFESLEALRQLKVFNSEKSSSQCGSALGLVMDLRHGDDGELQWRSEIAGPTATGLDGETLFKGSTATLKVHFPSAIRESNASEVSDDGMTGTWTIAMNEIVNDIAPLHASLEPISNFSLGGRSGLVIAGVLGVIALVGIGFVAGRRSSQKNA